jgi:alpha-galactosidase
VPKRWDYYELSSARVAEDSDRALLAELKEDLKPSVEYGAMIVNAMETGAPVVIHGNVPNRGLIDNLPEGASVEVACLVDRNGVQPTHLGALPPQLAAVNQTNINVQQLAVQAALTGNKEHVYHAIMLDPLTGALLTLDQIRAMTDELFAAEADYLPALA